MRSPFCSRCSVTRPGYLEYAVGDEAWQRVDAAHGGAAAA